MACMEQRWMHPQQCSHRCFQTGFPSINSIFSAGQMVAQIPHDVQLSVTEISSHSYVHGKQPVGVHQGMHQVRKKGRG